MSSKLSIITEPWETWLERYVPPNGLRANAEAQQQEVDAQLRLLVRQSPNENIPNWLERLTDRLSVSMSTRAWPTLKEIETACTELRRLDYEASPDRRQGGWHVDPLMIAARRIRSGGPVAVSFLWGRNAQELLRRGLVSQGQIDDLRDAAVRARCAAYGSPYARSDRMPEAVADWLREMEWADQLASTVEQAKASGLQERR
ncbi:hypothetical protein JI664_21525 [Rhodobacter sp. NTK016B]|uniref:hypothetical protein n=1 Tax=Rhodobacter sp. NTK016B TaxID=2759676 RepID=UPI001A8F419F|nr:hypothetical protein [Rhodobacter sp. NTK016B]MBN8294568.1 hypothetical protein [Rhodobacter sp. NTK016B]